MNHPCMTEPQSVMGATSVVKEEGDSRVGVVVGVRVVAVVAGAVVVTLAQSVGCSLGFGVELSRQ